MYSVSDLARYQFVIGRFLGLLLLLTATYIIMAGGHWLLLISQKIEPDLHYVFSVRSGTLPICNWPILRFAAPFNGHLHHHGRWALVIADFTENRTRSALCIQCQIWHATNL